MNVLLSFASDKTDIIQYFKQATGNTGKVFASDCKFNYSLTKADEYILLANSEEYISVLADYCKKNSISVIVPLSDTDLSVLSKYRNILQNLGITVIVSDEPVIDICIDRWKTCLFLDSIGIKHPKSYIDMEAAKRDIKSGILSFPLFLKPRFATEKTNGIDVASLDELDLFYRKMKQKILNTSDSHQESDAIIIQEETHGEKYGLCILNDLNGNYITASSLKKLSANKEETLLTSIETIQQFKPVIQLLSSELKHVANLEVNCCLQESGEIVISDLYARFGPNYPFWHIAGANFPKQIVDWLNGLPVLPGNISPVIGAMGSREKVLPVPFDNISFV